MTNEEKLEICNTCEYMIDDETNTIFGGEKNTMVCSKISSLIRAQLLLSCPEEKW